MKFNKDFVQMCKKTYPEWYDLHKLLARGSIRVGTLIDDDMNVTQHDHEELCRLVLAGCEEAKHVAQEYMNKKTLLAMFRQQYFEQVPHQGPSMDDYIP